MTRRSRGRRRGRGHHKIPIISAAILAGQIGLSWQDSGHNALQAADIFQSMYTGWQFRSASFDASRLIFGYAPWLVKGLIMKFARPIGAAPRMPIRGLPISLS